MVKAGSITPFEHRVLLLPMPNSGPSAPQTANMQWCTILPKNIAGRWLFPPVKMAWITGIYGSLLVKYLQEDILALTNPMARNMSVAYWKEMGRRPITLCG